MTTPIPTDITNDLKTLAGTYTNFRLSGKGANGYLYFAYHTLLERMVAIKYHDWSLDERQMEPRILASIDSPYVVQVLDADLVAVDRARFITPYYANGDLDSYANRQRLGLHHVISFVLELLAGLVAIHSKGYVHRDLKPENILVSDSSSPLIADFGSIRRIPDDRVYVPGSGHAILFRPPESFTTGQYNKQGDIYQVGLVLYQLCGGRLSYDGKSYLSRAEAALLALASDAFEAARIVDGAIERHACNGTLIDHSSLPVWIPGELRSVIRKSTHQQLDKRYNNPVEMMAGLNNAKTQTLDAVFIDGFLTTKVGDDWFQLRSRDTAYEVWSRTKSGEWRRRQRSPVGSFAECVTWLRKRH
jgi:serine/threonine protein kinase